MKFRFLAPAATAILLAAPAFAQQPAPGEGMGGARPMQHHAGEPARDRCGGKGMHGDMHGDMHEMMHMMMTHEMMHQMMHGGDRPMREGGGMMGMEGMMGQGMMGRPEGAPPMADHGRMRAGMAAEIAAMQAQLAELQAKLEAMEADDDSDAPTPEAPKQ